MFRWFFAASIGTPHGGGRENYLLLRRINSAMCHSRLDRESSVFFWIPVSTGMTSRLSFPRRAPPTCPPQCEQRKKARLRKSGAVGT